MHVRCGCAQVIPVSNFKCLFGAHERLLNNLVKRFDEGLIDDFYVYAFASPLSASTPLFDVLSAFNVLRSKRSLIQFTRLIHSMCTRCEERLYEYEYIGQTGATSTLHKRGHVHGVRAATSARPGRSPSSTTASRTSARNCASCSPPRHPTPRHPTRPMANAQRRTRAPARSRSSRAGCSTRTSWYSYSSHS